MKLPVRVFLATITILFFLIPSRQASGNAPAISLSAADDTSLAEHIGKEVVVEGVVISVGKGSKDGIRFLDFSKSHTSGFVVAVFPVAYPELQPIPSYVGQRLSIRGKLESYKGKTQIKVFKASQITIHPPHRGNPSGS
jgi:DNA/RNA endonuclease YhcR with UshA esterase domain